MSRYGKLAESMIYLIMENASEDAGASGPVQARIRHPIAVKLVLIITALLLLSLGAITVLVSVMVSADVQVTAEESNFSINSRTASEAEITLAYVRSGALGLLDSIDAASVAGPRAAELTALDSAAFFSRTPDTAAIFVRGAGEGRDIINGAFFRSKELDPALAADFLERENAALERCLRGETLILNAAPVFHVPLLVMFCPWQRKGNAAEDIRAAEGAVLAAAVFFSSESLSDNFGQGANSSFLVNDESDVLIHPDYELVRAGANLSNHPFIEILRSSAQKNLQTLYTGEGRRFFGAFQKISIGDTAVVTTIEYDAVFEGIVRTTRRNLFLTGAVLFASVILIWLFSKTISRPLRMLASAAGQIEEGNFAISLTPKTKDEIGALTASFGRMSNALGIFGRFTNREIAVRAMRGEIRPGGEPKNATVFFSDIRSFTAISENFTKTFGEEASDKIVFWLNEYFTEMVSCVEKTNGVVDKFIGDAVMAHWGTAYTAGSPEADAFNCVSAAVMMREALIKLNAARSGDSSNPVIKIGCGINSGIITAGQIGSNERMEYTVIGDAVNLASRTEALNKPLGTDILITENTWNLVGERLVTEEMPPVSVKGKEKPIRMFAVINIKAEKGTEQPRPRTLAELRKMLGIKPPDLSKVDTNAEEKKYKIG